MDVAERVNALGPDYNNMFLTERADGCSVIDMCGVGLVHDERAYSGSAVRESAQRMMLAQVGIPGSPERAALDKVLSENAEARVVWELAVRAITEIEIDRADYRERMEAAERRDEEIERSR